MRMARLNAIKAKFPLGPDKQNCKIPFKFNSGVFTVWFCYVTDVIFINLHSLLEFVFFNFTNLLQKTDHLPILSFKEKQKKRKTNE